MLLAEQYPGLKRGLWWLLAVSVVRHHHGFRRMNLAGVYQVKYVLLLGQYLFLWWWYISYGIAYHMSRVEKLFFAGAGWACAWAQELGANTTVMKHRKRAVVARK